MKIAILVLFVAAPVNAADHVSPRLDDAECALLAIIDKATLSGKVPPESMAGIKRLIENKQRDVQSLVLISMGVAWCSAEMEDDPKQKAEYLKIVNQGADALVQIIRTNLSAIDQEIAKSRNIQEQSRARVKRLQDRLRELETRSVDE